MEKIKQLIFFIIFYIFYKVVSKIFWNGKLTNFLRVDLTRKGHNERKKKTKQNKIKWSHEHAWLKPERDISIKQ